MSAQPLLLQSLPCCYLDTSEEAVILQAQRTPRPSGACFLAAMGQARHVASAEQCSPSLKRLVGQSDSVGAVVWELCCCKPKCLRLAGLTWPLGMAGGVGQAAHAVPGLAALARY